jgi:hypothetical protein
MNTKMGGGNLNRTFDASLLFKKGGSSNKNQFFRGGGGGKFWRKGRSYSGSGTRKSEGNGERLIYIELVGPNTIAVKMDGFYDQEIKDKIKGLPDAKYEGTSKEWFLRKDLKDKLIDSIGELCIDRGVQIVDIPDFVHDLSKNPIPFTFASKSLASDLKVLVNLNGKEFNYEAETKYQKRSIKDLPEKIQSNLYEFQK